jgi:hypothetical protein
MGQVISMQAYRDRRSADPFGRLDLAVRRLDDLVARRGDRVTVAMQRELERIAEAVSNGRVQEAADGAERLAGILQHPALSG